MPFSTSVTTIPLPSGSGEGVGMTISLLKALNHATVVLTADDDELTDEFRTAELTAIATHLSPTNLRFPPFVSQQFTTVIDNLQLVATDLNAEHEGWTTEETRQNLGLLVGRISTVCGFIDRELAGINDAVPGSIL
jgi:hypothetical protein